LLKEAHSTRADLINTAKEEAQAEADKILTQAQEAIQNEKRAAINELREQVGSIAMDIAEKVLQKELENKDKQVQLIDQLIQDSDLK
jgi:F-type H+-transporting ATPase subunit b